MIEADREAIGKRLAAARWERYFKQHPEKAKASAALRRQGAMTGKGSKAMAEPNGQDSCSEWLDRIERVLELIVDAQKEFSAEHKHLFDGANPAYR